MPLDYLTLAAGQLLHFRGTRYAIGPDLKLTPTPSDDELRQMAARGLVTIYPPAALASGKTPAEATDALLLNGSGVLTLATLLAWMKTQMLVPLDIARPALPSTAVTAATLGSRRSPIAGKIVGWYASVHAAPTAAALAVDILKAGTTIFSTPLTIDQSEFSHVTAATPAVLKTDATVDVAVDDLLTVAVSGTVTGAQGLVAGVFIQRA